MSYAGLYDANAEVREADRLRSETRRLARELEAAQKHFDAVLEERVILTGAVDAALRVLHSPDPKVRNRVTTLLEDATETIERLGREYRGEPEPQSQDVVNDSGSAS